MPTARHQVSLSETIQIEIVRLRHQLLAELVRIFRPDSLSHKEPSLDDGITAFMLTMIGPSDQSIHSNVPFWVSYLKYTVQKLRLNIETESMDREEKEERRRCVDRHWSEIG